MELNIVCKERCEAILSDCITDCALDTACLSECIREDTECIEGKKFLPRSLIEHTERPYNMDHIGLSNILSLSLRVVMLGWMHRLSKSSLSM